MQYDKKDYNEELHEMHKAMSVKQPFAQMMITAEREENGITYAQKAVDIRTRKVSYRGDVVICSTSKPEYDGYECGAMLGIVELYDVIPIAGMTEEDWLLSREDKKECEHLKGYAYKFRNPRRVVELPVKGNLGIYNLYCDKGDIVEYPQAMKIDKKSWKLINKRIRK